MVIHKTVIQPPMKPKNGEADGGTLLARLRRPSIEFLPPTIGEPRPVSVDCICEEMDPPTAAVAAEIPGSQEGSTTTTTSGVAGEVKRSLAQVKERLVAKIAAARGPAEEMVREAQGVTREALHRIRTHIVDFINSPDDHQHKVVDGGEKEANMEGSVNESDQKQKEMKELFVAPSSSPSFTTNAMRSRM